MGQGSLFGAAEVRGFGTPDLHVATVARDVANDLIVRHHYSHRITSSSTVHLGVYSDGNLSGILQFGWPMNPASGPKIVSGTVPGGFLELNRMWLDDALPPNTASRVLSYAMRYLKRASKSTRWVQSFADERCQGRLGVVYQAANFVYCGEHVATFWQIDGDWFHNSMMTRDPSLSPRAAYCQANRDRATPHHLRQFRYLYFLAPSDRKRLLLPSLPYPKPAVEVSDGDTPCDQQGGAGSIPAHRSTIGATP
jgi:hypothetical protein